MKYIDCYVFLRQGHTLGRILQRKINEKFLNYMKDG